MSWCFGLRFFTLQMPEVGGAPHGYCQKKTLLPSILPVTRTEHLLESAAARNEIGGWENVISKLGKSCSAFRVRVVRAKLWARNLPPVWGCVQDPCPPAAAPPLAAAPASRCPADVPLIVCMFTFSIFSFLCSSFFHVSHACHVSSFFFLFM